MKRLSSVLLEIANIGDGGFDKVNDTIWKEAKTDFNANFARRALRVGPPLPELFKEFEEEENFAVEVKENGKEEWLEFEPFCKWKDADMFYHGIKKNYLRMDVRIRKTEKTIENVCGIDRSKLGV